VVGFGNEGYFDNLLVGIKSSTEAFGSTVTYVDASRWRAIGRGLRHSTICDDPEVVQHVAVWIQRVLGAADFSYQRSSPEILARGRPLGIIWQLVADLAWNGNYDLRGYSVN
jgi:hypothetical protein